MKQKFALTTTLLISGIILSGCSSTPETPVKNLTPPIQMKFNKVQSTQYKGKLRPGLLHIQRTAQAYNLELYLDVSQNNIYFDGTPVNIEKISPKQPQNKTDKGSEKTNKPDTPPAKPETKSPEQNAKDIAKSGKYIVYAQSFLYEKKYHRALEEVNKAIELDPQSSIGYQLKGSIYYSLNNKAEAKKAWQKALEIDPTVDEVKTYLQKIDTEESKNREENKKVEK